jgi:hypothetical protein
MLPGVSATYALLHSCQGGHRKLQQSCCVSAVQRKGGSLGLTHCLVAHQRLVVALAVPDGLLAVPPAAGHQRTSTAAYQAVAVYVWGGGRL